jgi:hypothetical protein
MPGLNEAIPCSPNEEHLISSINRWIKRELANRSMLQQQDTRERTLICVHPRSTVLSIKSQIALPFAKQFLKALGAFTSTETRLQVPSPQCSVGSKTAYFGAIGQLTHNLKRTCWSHEKYLNPPAVTIAARK